MSLTSAMSVLIERGNEARRNEEIASRGRAGSRRVMPRPGVPGKWGGRSDRGRDSPFALIGTDCGRKRSPPVRVASKLTSATDVEVTRSRVARWILSEGLSTVWCRCQLRRGAVGFSGSWSAAVGRGRRRGAAGFSASRSAAVSRGLHRNRSAAGASGRSVSGVVDEHREVAEHGAGVRVRLEAVLRVPGCPRAGVGSSEA